MSFSSGKSDDVVGPKSPPFGKLHDSSANLFAVKFVAKPHVLLAVGDDQTVSPIQAQLDYAGEVIQPFVGAGKWNERRTVFLGEGDDKVGDCATLLGRDDIVRYFSFIAVRSNEKMKERCELRPFLE